MTVLNVKWCFKASQIYRSIKGELNTIFCNLLGVISSISFFLDASSSPGWDNNGKPGNQVATKFCPHTDIWKKFLFYHNACELDI